MWVEFVVGFRPLVKKERRKHKASHMEFSFENFGIVLVNIRPHEKKKKSFCKGKEF